MGDMDEVLVNCRKTLEEVVKQVKKAGFEVKITDEKGQKRKYPDWKKFFDSNSKSETIKMISKKMFDFLALGAHTGSSSLEMNHVYFALLQTFSLTHLVISRFKMLRAA